VAALEDLVERTRNSHGGVQVEWHLEIELDRLRLDTDTALVLYRAAQEGITNALRHGEAHRIVLALQGNEETVKLTLTDDGRGLPGPDAARETSTGHYGLRWLAERIDSLGGDLRLEPAASSGAQLTVRLPLPAAAAENT